MRTLTVAALIVLVCAPEAVVHPSFQMSFAATLALVAGYEKGMVRLHARRDSSFGARAALWGVNEIVALTVASLLAGFATTPYAAYHFHRMAPYGVLANLLAMPVVSAWVMPMAILGVVAMPFGFDAPCWRLMGYGIEWMDTVALWVAHLPGAFGRVTSFGTGPLLLLTAALLVIGLLKTPLRFCGLVLAGIAIVWAVSVPVPDLLIGNDGRSFAIRGADGRLAIHHFGGDTFAVREWLAADGDGRDVKDQSLGQGIACDAAGCVGRLADGTRIAYTLAPDGFADDCQEAVLVIAARAAPPPGCAATVIDRDMWRARGALALRHTPSGFAIDSVRSASLDRPWSPAMPFKRGSAAPAARDSVAAEGLHAPPRDATPQPEDVEADR